MTMRRTLLAATVALFGLSGFADAPQRYVVTYSVTVAGVEQASGQVLMVENGDARVERSDDEGGYAFNATLYPIDEGLMLKTDLWRGATKIAEPALEMAKGGQARMALDGDQQRIVIEIVPAD